MTVIDPDEPTEASLANADGEELTAMLIPAGAVWTVQLDFVHAGLPATVIEVTATVTQGGGSILDPATETGAPSVTLPTDGQGRAGFDVVLGPTAGLNQVTLTTDPPAPGTVARTIAVGDEPSSVAFTPGRPTRYLASSGTLSSGPLAHRGLGGSGILQVREGRWFAGETGGGDAPIDCPSLAHDR